MSSKRQSYHLKLESINMLHRVFGGCPKRNNCGLDRGESETCLYGPYEYCGKYRSIVQMKKETKWASKFSKGKLEITN